jgi:hypothetical protein
MLNIKIKTINHEEHPYPTVGNYADTHVGGRLITVSNMANEDYELLVAIHELIEQHLCAKRGISEQDITAFDVKFEKEREAGKRGPDEEPGFAKNAPYRREHAFATKIEKMLAKELGVEWELYDQTVMSL